MAKVLKLGDAREIDGVSRRSVAAQFDPAPILLALGRPEEGGPLRKL